MKSRFAIGFACVAALSILPQGAAVRAETAVDLELVLAVDVSLSMEEDEQRLQRDGYVAAFRDPAVIDAIRSGLHGRIAVTYVEWAGENIQSVVVPWRIIGTVGDAHAFAGLLAEQAISQASMTSISGAVMRLSALFEVSGVSGLRRVIDVSGDGPNNEGPHVEAARDAVVSRGIVVNGLAILLGSSSSYYSYFDIPELDRYYRDCVVGGPGAFSLAVRAKAEFATAIRQKLLLEIAGAPGRVWPRAVPAGLSPAQENYDCLIGEKLWQRFLRDGFLD